MSDVLGITQAITGWLDPQETQQLHALAQRLGGNVVEIGSYQGRSTVALALGVQDNGGTVWAIDPHDGRTTFKSNDLGERRAFSGQDNVAFMRHVAPYAGVVRVINLPSHQAARAWEGEIQLLFIDGDHSYEAARQDWDDWTPYLAAGGMVAIHDTIKHPGPMQLVEEVVTEGWRVVTKVDATTILERAE